MDRCPFLGNPVGVHVHGRFVTQGALADSRPWAEFGNPYGVRHGPDGHRHLTFMHTIRLRGPWELYLPGRDQPRRVEMPATWQTLLALAGDTPLPSPARLLRRFGLPTGIAPSDRLNLVFESAAACQIELNGKLLGSIAVAQQCSSFDVTQLLEGRNELVIVLEIPPQEFRPPESSCPLSDVRLEISHG